MPVMMPVILSEEERSALKTAQARSPQVRHWRRYQAILRRAAGGPPAGRWRRWRVT
jgi:hypothetical protein